MELRWRKTCKIAKNSVQKRDQLEIDFRRHTFNSHGTCVCLNREEERVFGNSQHNEIINILIIH